MIAMPICSKTLNNLLLQNRESFGTESLYRRWGVKVHRLFKWWPWVDVWSFKGKVKFASLYICIGKMLKSNFLKIHLRLMAETYNVLSKKQTVLLQSKILFSGVICPCPWVIHMYKISYSLKSSVKQILHRVFCRMSIINLFKRFSLRTRWPPYPYMLNKSSLEPRKIQSWILVQNIRDSVHQVC